ncbi:MAG TPA: sulfatase-like hydrolase/transferase, partial [bacterium]|nr:sulfatase-like hydrolase/transferase [bacterium]
MMGSTLSRREFCKQFGTGLLAVSSISTFGFAQGSSDPPNIIIILADDLGYGDLSSYGATDLQTPNVDTLMKAGMRFNQFYANCPVCSPTRAALLTGRYPDVVGVPG